MFGQPGIEVNGEVVAVVPLASLTAIVTLIADFDAPAAKQLGEIEGIHRASVTPLLPWALVQAVAVFENFSGGKPLYLLMVKQNTNVRQQVDTVQEIAPGVKAMDTV